MQTFTPLETNCNKEELRALQEVFLTGFTRTTRAHSHTAGMQLLLTCSECGHQEWGDSTRVLMNKIKLLNHATKEHPTQIERVMRLSLPKYLVNA